MDLSRYNITRFPGQGIYIGEDVLVKVEKVDNNKNVKLVIVSPRDLKLTPQEKMGE